MAILVLVLAVIGILGLFAAAFGATIGNVAPGWLGAGLLGLAWLLSSNLP